MSAPLRRTRTAGTPPQRRRYQFVDLFCGAGGFTEGFLQATTRSSEFHLVAASDVHRHAQATHEFRFRSQLGIPYLFLRRDIRDPEFLPRLRQAVPDGTEIDVVCGGPPCQGFSVFGARRREDPRNDLFRPYLQAVHALKPRYFILENVPGFVYMYRGMAEQGVIDAVAALREPGYSLTGPIFVDATSFGVPQSRERVIFVGSRADQVGITTISAPEHVHALSVGEAISDLAFLGPGGGAASYDPSFPAVSDFQTEARRGRSRLRPAWDGALHNHEASRHTDKVLARFRLVPKGRSTRDVKETLIREGVDSGKKWCVRLDDAEPSFTITTIPDDFIHYSQDRSLTVRECARLQSFDDSFIFLGPRTTGGGGAGNKVRNTDLPQYTQVGNAVPPLMARAIALTLLKQLEKTSARTGGPERLSGTARVPLVAA